MEGDSFTDFTDLTRISTDVLKDRVRSGNRPDCPVQYAKP